MSAFIISRSLDPHAAELRLKKRATHSGDSAGLINSTASHKSHRKQNSKSPMQQIIGIYNSFVDDEFEEQSVSRIQWEIQAYYSELGRYPPKWLYFPPPDPQFEDEITESPNSLSANSIKRFSLVEGDAKIEKFKEINKIQQQYETRRESIIYGGTILEPTEEKQKKHTKLWSTFKMKIPSLRKHHDLEKKSSKTSKEPPWLESPPPDPPFEDQIITLEFSES
ncbi:hypothetical protein BB560_005026, partial [Smittium megazygosporum]